MEIKIREEDSAFMYDFIQKIIDDCGPRMPCSRQEAKAAKAIKQEFEKVCDSAIIEEFVCAPRAFLGYIKVNVILVLISFILFFLYPLSINGIWTIMLSFSIFCLNLFAILIIWYEFFNYNEFIDPLFKKRQSQNVIGKFEAESELNNIIIFSGHHDSALQFNLLRYLKIGYPIIIFIGLGIMFLWFLFSIVYLILSLFNISYYSLFYTFSLSLLLIGIIPLIFLFNFVSPGEKANQVPGAVDNLSAVAIVIAIGKYLQDNRDLIPKNTEIRLISFGCEEAGLRGAYRYVEKHLKELENYNTEVVNMDAIQSTQHIKILDFEPTTRTEHSQIVVNKLLESAKLQKVPASSFGSGSEKLLGQISGGTDATAFSKANIKASTIAATDIKQFLKFYHQPTDTLDMIEEGSLEAVLKICLGYLVNTEN